MNNSSGMIEIDDKEQQKRKYQYRRHDKEMDRNRIHRQ